MPIPVALVTAAELERAARRRRRPPSPRILADLERLVNIDCGSYTKAGVDEVGRWTADRLRALGATVTVEPNDLGLGDTVIGELAGDDPDGPTLLCIGHMDTVFDPGTAAERPFAIADGIATGPGVTDMKSGLLAGLYAIAAIRDGARRPPARAPGVRRQPRRGDRLAGLDARTSARLAADADACLVLECARANGDIVSSRKGNLGLGITVHGRAAHAGVEPEKGRSAILEAARIVDRAPRAQRPLAGRDRERRRDRGRDAAQRGRRALLDGGRRARRRPATRWSRRRRPSARRCAHTVVPDVTVDVAEQARHWPMEKLERSGRLVGHAAALAGELGFELHDAATGGASDANTTAGMGVPTIDGLGPIGGLDHAPGEYLEVASIVPRTTLLAALITAIGRDPEVRAWRGARLAGAAAARRPDDS